MNWSIQIKALLGVVVRTALGGAILVSQACTEERSLKDLEEYKRAVRTQIQSELPQLLPLPERRTIETFRYSAASIDSPFSEKNVISTVQPSPAEAAVFPNQDRAREPLEFFSLNTIKMVGTLKRDNDIYAIVLTPEETAHRVSVGEYMGTDLGRITAISDGEITLEETVYVKKGRWEKRKARITLIE